MRLEEGENPYLVLQDAYYGMQAELVGVSSYQFEIIWEVVECLMNHILGHNYSPESMI